MNVRRAALLVVLLASCKNNASHIYVGEKYEPGRDCVDGPTAVDVVEGDLNDAPCAAICLVSPPQEAGDRPIYVSKQCPPLPQGFDVSGANAECPAAIAAYTRTDICQDDGGSIHPLDAGSDATLPADAGAE